LVASSLTRFDRIGKVVGAVTNVNADTGNRLRLTEFGRALQLRIRNRADDNEVLGERKRKGLRNAIGTQIRFGGCAAPEPATRKRESGCVTLGLRLGSPTRVLLLGPFARNGRPVFEPVGDTWFASSH